MVLSEVFERFCQESPVPVMVRATLENVLSAEQLDRLFAETARRQHPGELLFSTVVDLMSLVVGRIRPSVHAAYQARAEEIGVAIKSVYNKLAGVEPRVSRELVRQTAARTAQIIDRTGGLLPSLMPGYRVKILDGNHLARSQRRLKELRQLNAAPLPGHALVVLDPARMLAIDAFPCEDGHAQERSLLPQVLETVEAGDLWIADRNFCTMDFLAGIRQRGGFFIIRQHAQTLRYELVGKRRRIGRVETGTVYEQKMRLLPNEGEPWEVRRVTVELDEPTRNGDQEIHVLTNLPEEIDSLVVADTYRRRWTVETAFQELEATLDGELQTLAYPKAALFGFCTALVSYNVMSVVKAALRGVHGVEKIEKEVSGYYLADEVRGMWRGMMLMLPPEFWRERFATQTPSQLGRFLLRQAKAVPLWAFRKHPRGPKKKPPSPMNKKHRNHVSTARVLAQRERNCNCHC